MVFVRSSNVTNGWLVTIRDPKSVIVTLQGYNGFLGVTHVTNSIGHFQGPYKWYIWFLTQKFKYQIVAFFQNTFTQLIPQVPHGKLSSS